MDRSGLGYYTEPILESRTSVLFFPTLPLNFFISSSASRIVSLHCGDDPASRNPHFLILNCQSPEEPAWASKDCCVDVPEQDAMGSETRYPF